jgi:predicted dehydrogenase
MATENTRREFAKLAAGTMTALSASRVMGANDRIRMGLIGCGNRGSQIWSIFLKQPEVEPVAVCDVYTPYRDAWKEKSGPNVRAYKDFRELLAQRDIDAVAIATPDHWHALMMVQACEAGKDVYCEKPLSLTVADGRKMLDAARKHDRLVQTGCQQRSGEHYQRAVELIRAGKLGEVHTIDAGFMRNAIPGFRPREITGELPPTLDWDMWLGPAPLRPFDPFRCLYNFRWFWDYSGGQMTNWGAHDLDICRWMTGARAPAEVAGMGGRFVLRDGGETPDIQNVLYRFDKVVVTWTAREVSEGDPFSIVVHGTLGTMRLNRRGFQIKPELTEQSRKPAMEPMQMAGGDFEERHIQNFLQCVKTRKRPNGDVEEGHLTAAMCHLGNISTRIGRGVRWDPQREEIPGDKEANDMLSRPYRAPWKLS